MTDLTKQLEKGELKTGWYYTQIEGFREISPDLYDRDDNSWLCDSDKDIRSLKILAKVPSYNELNNLQIQYVNGLEQINHFATALENADNQYNDLRDECEELKEENARLKKELSEHKEFCCCFDNEVLRLENAKLKEENAKLREFKDNAIEIKRLEDLNKNYEYLIKQRDIYNKELQEENIKLKKQLEIATKALEKYADNENWIDAYCDDGNYDVLYVKGLLNSFGYETAENALNKIKQIGERNGN